MHPVLMLLGLIFFLPEISNAEEAILEFNYSAPLSVAENSPNGTEIGIFKPTGKSNGAQLSYSVVPSLPVGLSPRLWLVASELDWADRYWQDKSENQKHAEIQGSAHGYPYLKIDQQNGLSVMRYPGINDAYHSFGEISNIRTAFWVISKSKNSWGMLLGNSSGHPFHFGNDNSIFHHQYSLSAVRNGILSINGNEVDGTNTPFPSELSIISLQLSGEAKASNFSMDRGINGRFFKGDLGELILFDQALNQAETRAVESYLHRKWDLPLAYPPVLPPFSVSEDGVVSANRSFDYEELSQYPLRVKATDTAGRSVVQTFHIAIQDVIEDLDQDGIQDAYDIDIDGDGSINDFEISYGTDPRDPASVNRSPNQLRLENQKSVVENTPAGFVIGQFQADDADQDVLSYSVSGNNFTIEQNGTLRTARSFDHEQEPIVAVTLVANDPRGASNSAIFSIQVLDLPNDLDEDGIADAVDPDRDGDGMSNSEELVNYSDPDDPTSINYAPTDLNSTTALTIIENRPANTVMGQFSAADQESPDSLRFALVSGQGDSGNALFSLDANGTLRSLNPFDFENNAMQYSIRVAVYDEQNASLARSFEIDLLDEDTFSPISLNRNLMLWLDASDRATLDRGEYMGELGTPEDGEQVKFWADKSGKEYHAKSIEGAATYKSEEVLGNPTVYFQNNTFEVEDSSEDFDGWDKMTVLLVLEQKSRFAWQAWIGKWNQVNHTTEASWHFLGRRPDISPPWYSFRINGTSATDRIELSNNQTAKLFNPSLLTLSFGDNQRRVFLNGTSALTAEDNGSILSTSFPVTIGGEADKGGSIRMNFSEILIFNDALDDTDRQRVEGYLAHKWNLVRELDEYHPYKNGGMMDGTTMAISEELPVGTPIIQLSELDPDYNASWTYSLVSPSETNDNQFFQLQDHDPFNPKEFEGLSLWLDASKLTTTPTTWTDLSNQGNDADKIGSPSVVTDAHNGLTLMNYNAGGQRHKFPMIENIRTVFWVTSQDSSVNGSGYRYLLTRSTSSGPTPDWHNSNNGKFYGNYTNAKVKNGVTRMDGTVIDGTVTNYPNNLSIISVRTTGDCIADSFGYDRGYTPRQWIGNLGELIIYNEALTDQQIELIEVYLANKWNIGHSSPNFSTVKENVVNYSTNYTLQTGLVFDLETNSSEYSIQIAGTSESGEDSLKNYKIYLSNVVEDMDGDGIEDHYDLDDDGDGFSDLIEIAYPSDPRDPDSLANVAPHLINFTGDLSVPENLQVGSQVTTFSATDDDGDSNFTYSIPKTIEKLEPVLWLDANHPSAKSSTWEDLSTYNRDAIRYNTPTVIENAQNGLSVMRYQARASNTDYHEWPTVSDIRTVVAVLKRSSGAILSASNHFHFFNNSTSQLFRPYNTHTHVRNGQTRLNGLSVDGTTTPLPSSQFSIISLTTTGNVFANRIGKDRNIGNSSHHFGGDYAEILVFSQPLEDWEIESVEYSLARKWGLESNLAESHFYKNANSTNGNDFFSIEENGGLSLAQPIDYETDRNFSITVRVTDPHGASFDKRFTIEVTDIAENVDGDGTPDHLDNDIDNDGLSNADELLGKSDPYNSNSTNRPPNAITSSNLSFTENLATGTKIVEFNATDPDGNENHTFSLYPLLEVSPSLWLDGSDIDGNLKPDTYAVGDDISLWVDKSGNGYDFNETKGQPTYSDKEGKGVVKFDGQTMIWTGNSLSPDFNNFTIMSVARYTGGKNGRIISDASKNWFFGFHSSGLDSFYANGHLANKRDIPVDQNWHLHVGTINSNDYGQGWVDQISMVDSTYGAGADYQPRLLALGGWRRSNTWFTEMSKAEVAELLVFDWVLNTSEIKQAEDYLIGKWNLPLPTGNAAVDFFEIDQNGSLFTKRAFNFETDDHNYSLRVRVTDDYGAYKEEDFLIQLTNILEDADGNGVEDYDGNQSLTPTNIELSGGALTVTENAELGTVVGQIRAIDPDGDIFHHYSLSTSADHQRFHPSKVDGLTAWFDASDASTISTYEDSSKLYTWRNKVDQDTYLRPNHGREPDANATINGLNAISFQKNDKQMEFLKGWKNHEEWNPAGENGKTSGANDDTAIFLIHQSKVSKKSAMPFGFGWSGHFLWYEGIHFDPARISTGGLKVGKTHLVALYNSKTSNQRGIWVDGNLIVSGSPVSRNISGAFFFPDKHNESLDYASDCLLGEILVIRGVMEERDHLEIEGYLAHKWGLADTLPHNHIYSKTYGHFSDSDPFLSIDKNGTIRTATTFDHEIDSNLTITIRATDDDGFSIDKNFTIMIENVQESDLDNDGIEDLIDDDIDGDGLSNTDEWKNNSDPFNPNSQNRAPTDIQASTLSFKENKTVGSTILSFTNNDPDEGQTHRYRLTSNGKIGWRTSHLTGDKNSGINSNITYTCAVNINGEDQVVGGVTFKGEEETYGQGWEITDGFTNLSTSQQSTVNGKIGKILSDGMRWNGESQKIKLTGLTAGKKYVFSLYSQAWGTEVRRVIISCSDLDESLTINQSIFGASQNDGLLIECTYIAQSVSTEFSIEQITGGTWHLYAFSNHEALPFSLEENGELRVDRVFDYETEEKNYTLQVLTTDDHNLSFIKEFILTLENEIEDLDGDMVENHEDSDIDGDGVSNEMELAYGTDPWDKASVNEPPSQMFSSQTLQVYENSQIGTMIGRVEALDPQGASTLKFSMLPVYPDNIKPMVWLDGEEADMLEKDEIQGQQKIRRWKNKAGNRHDFIQYENNNKPRFDMAGLNGFSTVRFEENNFLHSEGILPVGENFSIILVSNIENVNTTQDALFSLGSKSGGPQFDFLSQKPDDFMGYFSSSKMGENHTFFQENQNGAAIYELSFNFDQQKVECRLNGFNQGTTSYNAPPDPLHIFRLNANLEVTDFTEGEIAEFFIFNQLLTNFERRKVKKYLSSKWAIPVHNPLPDHHFKMNSEGFIYTTKSFDFEQDQLSSIKVKVIDDQNLSLTQEFEISLLNVIEDRDGDGIEDAYDFDFDNDGIEDAVDPDDDHDGFADSYEIAYGSDPFNANSIANKFPTALYLNGSNIVENSPLNTVVGKLVTEDPDPGDTFSYTLVSGEGSGSNSLFTLSTEGILTTAYVFDHEDRKDHSIRVRVEDQFGASLENSFSLTIDNLYLPVAVTHPHTEGANEVLIKGEILENGGEAPETFGIQLSSNITFENADTLLASKITEKFFSITKRELALARTYYYRAFAINSEGTAYGAIMRFHQPGPDWWLDLSDQTINGWIIDSWMGSMHPYPNQWAYHGRLGWVFMSKDGSNGYWIWRHENGWLWTNRSTWTFLWSHQSNGWLYLWPENNKALFYDYGNGSIR